MRTRRTLYVSAALVLGLAVAGCTASEAPPPDASASASPAGPPAFVPGGSAGDNKPWFDHVNASTLEQHPTASSRELVDGLVAGGFDKRDMEVTFDRTNVDLEADYIIVSVKIGEECLIGQRGPRGYTSEITAPLGTGKCLIGHTQPIDW